MVNPPGTCVKTIVGTPVARVYAAICTCPFRNLGARVLRKRRSQVSMLVHRVGQEAPGRRSSKRRRTRLLGLHTAFANGIAMYRQAAAIRQQFSIAELPAPSSRLNGKCTCQVLRENIPFTRIFTTSHFSYFQQASIYYRWTRVAQDCTKKPTSYSTENDHPNPL